ncbi:MAG: sulfatase, partial [Bacteroides sp.]
MKPLLYLLSSATALSAFAQKSPDRSKKVADKTHPNVVVIVADDLGYGDLSCYGAKRLQTPGMDRIANEGIRFTQGYCTAATSTPSRYSLLTGCYPWSNPQARILPGNAALIIDTQAITLPKVMQRA